MKFFAVVLAFFAVVNAVPTLNTAEEINSGNSIGKSIGVNDKTEIVDGGLEGRDIIGTILDTLACRSTTQFGYSGRCVPRQCCRRDNGVDNLCSRDGFVCCYSGDRCQEDLFRKFYESVFQFFFINFCS